MRFYTDGSRIGKVGNFFMGCLYDRAKMEYYSTEIK